VKLQAMLGGGFAKDGREFWALDLQGGEVLRRFVGRFSCLVIECSLLSKSRFVEVLRRPAAQVARSGEWRRFLRLQLR
jgi:hypothetical protein